MTRMEKNPGSSEDFMASQAIIEHAADNAAAHEQAAMPGKGLNPNAGIGLPKSLVQVHKLSLPIHPEVRERADNEYPGRDVDVHL